MNLLIDNYDSFTHNIYQLCEELNRKTIVLKNDEITIEQIINLNPKSIIISPGPCTPKEAGISVDVVKKLGGHIPILGICLGHQCIADAFGGKVKKMKKVYHGKSSGLYFQDDSIFDRLEQSSKVARYHSLSVEDLPEMLKPIAWSDNGVTGESEIMALKHIDKLIYGFQFHPESILTDNGSIFFENFFSLCDLVN